MDDDTAAAIEGAHLAEAALHGAKKTHLTPYQMVLAAGAIAGALTAVSIGGSMAADILPFAKRADVVTLGNRVATLESSISGIQLNQLESLELQLTDRIQKLDDDMLRAGANATDLRHDKNAAQQRLDDVKAKKTRLEGVLPQFTP